MVALGLILCLLQTSLSLNWTETSPEEGHLSYLHDLLFKVHEEQPVAAILVMKHSQDNNCLLEQVHLSDWPVLRFNEKARINMSSQISRQALAMICLSKDNAVELLSLLAANFNRMRGARIIVWLNDEELLEIIAEQADRHRFYNVLALQPKGNYVIIHQMQPFPLASFTKRDNLSSERIFIEHWRNFQLKKVFVKQGIGTPESQNTRDRKTEQEKLIGLTPSILTAFAEGYNVSLIAVETKNDTLSSENMIHLVASGELDISTLSFSIGSVSRVDGIQSTVSVAISNIYLIVPCGQEFTLRQVFRFVFQDYEYKMLACFLSLTLLDSFVTSLNNYLNERPLNFHIINFLINLRVFRGTLGYAIPTRYLNRTSLRQCLITISVFGLLITTYFNAALRTVLTKHPDYKHIETFEQLLDSKLPVLFDWSTKHLVEEQNGPDFFKNHIPNANFMAIGNQLDLLFSLNRSFVYQSYSYFWRPVNMIQMSRNVEYLCRSKDLHFAKDVPMSPIVQNNSVYGYALDRFILFVQSSGLDLIWKERFFIDMFYSRKRQMSRIDDARTQSVFEFNWLWKVLCVGLGLSMLVFCIELIVAWWQKRRLGEAQEIV